MGRSFLTWSFGLADDLRCDGWTRSGDWCAGDDDADVSSIDVDLIELSFDASAACVGLGMKELFCTFDAGFAALVAGLLAVNVGLALVGTGLTSLGSTSATSGFDGCSGV